MTQKNTLESLLILVGLPVSFEELKACKDTGCSDFYRSLSNQGSDIETIWNSYSKELLLLKSLLANLEAKGATVLHVSSLESLKNIGHYETLVLIAHHSDCSDEIDLLGRMCPTSEIIQAIPEDFSGLIDLSSCYSHSFHEKLKIHCPESRIISSVGKTSLHVQMRMLFEVTDLLIKNDVNYETAFRTAMSRLIKESSKSSEWAQRKKCAPSEPKASSSFSFKQFVKHLFPKDKPEKIHLGGNTKSSVFAPKTVLPGDTFLVQVFIHNDKDSETVSLNARMIDAQTEERISKPLLFKIKKGDDLVFQLEEMSNFAKDFSIDQKRKKMTWTGEPNSVEFAVTVSPLTQAKSFIGKIRIFSNKKPVGEGIFKTEIEEDASKQSKNSAAFEFSCYNQEAEIQRSTKNLLQHLEKQKNDIIKKVENEEFPSAMKELEICEKCIALIRQGEKNFTHDIKKVFISSTSDMKKYRQTVKNQVEACHMFPEMYENWSQYNKYPRDLCCEKVLSSDIFICILGERYGFVEPAWNMSMTEIEYRVALSSGKPILIYILEGNNEDYMQEETELKDRQSNLLQEMKKERLVEFFNDEIKLMLQSRADLLTITKNF